MTVHVEVLKEKGESFETDLGDGQHIYFPTREVREGHEGYYFVVIKALANSGGANVYHIDAEQIPNPENPRGRISPWVFERNKPVRNVVPGEAWPKKRLSTNRAYTQ